MINIADQLHAATEHGIVAAANEIHDPVLNQRQTNVNRSINNEVFGAISFEDTNTNQQVSATRFSAGDTTINSTDYLCFVDTNGNRYYITSYDANSYVYVNTDQSGMLQCGVITTSTIPLRENIPSTRQNVMIGTEAERLAFTPFEGLEWKETHIDPNTGEDHIIRYLYENGVWSVIESPETESDETVVLHISTYDGQGTVQGLSVGVTDNTTHDASSYTLNASGQCTFKILKGHTYTVTVASLTGYHDLPDETFEAVQDERSIYMVFQAAATSYERVVVHITAYNSSMQNSSSLQDEFVGETITCHVQGESDMTALIGADHTAVFNIPYGKQYSIHVPYVTGFIAIYAQEWSHTASIPERTLPAHYLIWTGSDIMVLDRSNGQLLSYDAVNAMSTAEKETLASHCALYVNTSALQAANASFCYKLPLETASRAWANQNVAFDTDLLPYKQSHAAAVVCLNGPTNTEHIRSIGDSLGVETPAADYCYAQELVVNGETTKGYLGEYGEMKTLADNLSQLTAFHLLLGFNAPAFNSGVWWTSTQYSDTDAVRLDNGGFGSVVKTRSFATIALFRPFGN